MAANNAIAPYGLLYSRDPDSTDFPLTEIKRACRCFRQRRELVGLEPAVIHIHPDHLPLIDTAPLELIVNPDPKVGRYYIWLRGRLAADSQPEPDIGRSNGLPG